MKNGMTQIGIARIFLRTYHVLFADALRDGVECYALSAPHTSQGNVYFLRKQARQRLVENICGFVSRDFEEQITGKDAKYLDWPSGLWIGKRQIRVELVKTGTQPHDYLVDLDENYILIQEPRRINKLVLRVFEAANSALMDWQRASVRRAYRREGPAFHNNAPVSFEALKGKVKRPRRVRPGELLPASEREEMLAAGDAVLKEMVPPVARPAPEASEERKAA